MTRHTPTGNITHMSPKAREPRKVWKETVLDERTFPTKALRKLKPRLRELVEMLEYARPGRSKTEEEFISKYIDTLPGIVKDDYGNRYTVIGREQPTIAWSSHTDTVHYSEGKQAVELRADGVTLQLDANSDANCLGGDCTTGVWLMRRLIMAGKPGLYIFHRDEESGGLGSTWIAENRPEFVAHIKAMIALDRRGFTDVITEQTTGVTASNTFAQSLADQLKAGRFRPDDGGIFTDSAFYAHLIPECTNISVGYEAQHTKRETQDLDFADCLLLDLLKVDYSKLEIARDPEAQDDRRSYGYGGYYNSRDYDAHSAYDAESRHEHEQWSSSYEAWSAERAWKADSAWDAHSDHNLVELVRKNPEAVAHLLRTWDITEDDVYEAIDDYGMELERLCGKR